MLRHRHSIVARVMQHHRLGMHHNCNRNAECEIIKRHKLTNTGEHPMQEPITLFKASDGSIQEVLESQPVTLEDIDRNLAELDEKIEQLQEARARIEALMNSSDSAPVTDVPAQPLPAEQPAPAPVPANSEQGQAPAVPAVDAPQADNAALNNGQVNPAEVNNPPQPAPVQPGPQPGQLPPQPEMAGPAPVPAQPVIGA